jgi:hypothetical protein
MQIIGIKEFAVDNMGVLQQLIEHSSNARSTGSTGANDESSRWGAGGLQRQPILTATHLWCC